MNVLEKILEEIEHEIMTNKEIGRKQCEGMTRVMNIIHKHIDEITNINISKIAAINKEMEDYLFEKYCIEGFDEELDKIFKKYLELSKDINVHSNWIPYSERLPEETGYYLVQLSRKLPNEDYADRVVVLYNAEEKEFMCYEKLIEAWMPLPEPYK